MRPYFIQSIKLKSFPSKVRGFLSEYWENTEDDEGNHGELVRKTVEIVGLKYEDTTSKWNSCDRDSCKQLERITCSCS